MPNSTIRKVIARRLAESKQTIPHFYVTMDFEIDALLKLRADLNAKSPKDGPGAFKLSVNDLVIKAVGGDPAALPQCQRRCGPRMAILQFDDVDVSVAVSTPTGLITPIIRKADQKGLSTISNEMKDLAARAPSRQAEARGVPGRRLQRSPTWGCIGVQSFSAIINPPQAGDPGGRGRQQRPVVKDGALAIATVMTCTLSVDHRVVDGALARRVHAGAEGHHRGSAEPDAVSAVRTRSRRAQAEVWIVRADLHARRRPRADLAATSCG